MVSDLHAVTVAMLEQLAMFDLRFPRNEEIKFKRSLEPQLLCAGACYGLILQRHTYGEVTPYCLVHCKLSNCLHSIDCPTQVNMLVGQAS